MKRIKKIILPIVLSIIATQTHALSEFFQPKVYDMTLLNALSTYYQHYQNDPCDRQVIDLIGTGFYQYQVDNASPRNKNQIVGAYIKGQISLGDLWVQVDAALGKRYGFEKTSFGAGDVLTKLGYDFSIGDSHYIGVYAGVGIPTGKKSAKEEAKEAEGEKKQTEKASPAPKKIIFNANPLFANTISTGNSQKYTLFSPAAPKQTAQPAPASLTDEEKAALIKAELEAQLRSFGSRNFTIPVGMHMGFTLYENEDHHFSFLTDIRYLHAFSAKYYFSTPIDFVCSASSSPSSATATTTTSSTTTTTTLSATCADYTPGNQISMWNAFHWAWNEWNLELGNSLYGNFGAKLKAFATEDAAGVDLAQPLLSEFGINPYVAFSYNTTICDHPFMFGIGVGYRFDKNKLCGTSSQPDMLQTASAWATLALSF